MVDLESAGARVEVALEAVVETRGVDGGPSFFVVARVGVGALASTARFGFAVSGPNGSTTSGAEGGGKSFLQFSKNVFGPGFACL